MSFETQNLTQDLTTPYDGIEKCMYELSLKTDRIRVKSYFPEFQKLNGTNLITTNVYMLCILLVCVLWG